MDHVSDGHTVYQTDFASIGEWQWGVGKLLTGGTTHDVMNVSPHRVKN